MSSARSPTPLRTTDRGILPFPSPSVECGNRETRNADCWTGRAIGPPRFLYNGSIRSTIGALVPRHFFVYVIELEAAVGQIRKFRKANPDMKEGASCFYVGSSFQTPDNRFDQHKQGYKSNRYARKFGFKLRPDLFDRYNPIPTRKDALDLEEYLAERLRGEGFGVWQG